MTIKRLGEQGTKRVLQEIKGKANKTHTHTLDDVTETTSKKIMTSAEREKLSGIADNANNYTHPSSHAASMITETTDKKVMTKNERDKLAKAIVNKGTLPYEGSAVIEPGGDMSGIDNNTVIFELE